MGAPQIWISMGDAEPDPDPRGEKLPKISQKGAEHMHKINFFVKLSSLFIKQPKNLIFSTFNFFISGRCFTVIPGCRSAFGSALQLQRLRIQITGITEIGTSKRQAKPRDGLLSSPTVGMRGVRGSVTVPEG